MSVRLFGFELMSGAEYKEFLHRHRWLREQVLQLSCADVGGESDIIFKLMGGDRRDMEDFFRKALSRSLRELRSRKKVRLGRITVVLTKEEK